MSEEQNININIDFSGGRAIEETELVQVSMDDEVVESIKTVAKARGTSIEFELAQAIKQGFINMALSQGKADFAQELEEELILPG
jgi:hypothetical protein